MIAIGGVSNLLLSLYVINFKKINDLCSYRLVDECSETELTTKYTVFVSEPFMQLYLPVVHIDFSLCL